ncbi:MAG TPA: SDR family NAD(P)-dependent oxidoreductase [Acidimicrobiales bacterium]|nr:SDR family NAD(P)-dependent oxidoreductase [Acidimicrobiales bacterium]
MDYEGKVAVVTGGAGGIGRGLVHALLTRGARVVVADVEAPALSDAVDQLASRGTVRGVRTDVADPGSVEALAENVYTTEGRCDLLFANAGVTSGGGGLPWEQEINDWRWCFSVNVFGVAQTVLTFLPRMLAAGTPGEIVATSSGDGGVAPVPYASVYASSKAAVSCFIEAVAHQLRTVGALVGAHVFYPGGGLLDTGLWTAGRNRPAELERVRPRPPAPGTTFPEFKAQLEAAGLPADIVDLDWLGTTVLEHLDEGRYILGPGSERFAPLLHARADAIAKGELPPTLLH